MSLAAPVLVVSRLGDGALQHVIAEQIGVHPAALVRTLDLAEEAGLLERRTVPGNRRLRAIYLLPEGRRLSVKMEHALTTLRTTLLKDIPKSEIDTAVRVLQAFEERARLYAEQERASTL
jgi:MarR family transcriptional regulator for hemolysin